jgi:flavin reductase (DIM6/NTAB) family NADH-FMN oxidoreductase RutF
MVDRLALREALRHVVTGVTVVVTEVQGRVRAMTANSFTSVSLEPPLVLFCVGEATHTGKTVEAWQAFSVNVLRLEQAALANYFAGAWREATPPPFRFVSGVAAPRLEGCAASFACSVHTRLRAGDHWIVVGEIVDIHHGVEPRQPLALYGGRYRRLADDPADTSHATSGGPDVFPQVFHEF